MDFSWLLVFMLTFFLMSVSPGICMLLAMSLGANIGVRRTLWMMLGVLVGIASIATLALIGIANLLSRHEWLMLTVKYLGPAYLIYLGVKSWRTPYRASEVEAKAQSSAGALALSGFSAAISNPKAWAFLITLLPPFIRPEQPMMFQSLVLLTLVVVIEFSCLLLYAYGGRQLSAFLLQRGRGEWLNRLSGALLFLVAALWLSF
ncbi:LysE family translocator [Shewanella insulae]|uniref:LysE family translocator n=1 Tax=Shewanella insulae TaxID=2681496 RepID=UPI002480311C|nr:LysE family translocator [Shewanella insulae]